MVVGNECRHAQGSVATVFDGPSLEIRRLLIVQHVVVCPDTDHFNANIQALNRRNEHSQSGESKTEIPIHIDVCECKRQILRQSDAAIYTHNGFSVGNGQRRNSSLLCIN